MVEHFGGIARAARRQGGADRGRGYIFGLGLHERRNFNRDAKFFAQGL